jgi:protein-tyrosine-phosphatase
MSERVYNVLFLCTSNSARSIMAEAILNQMGRGHFRAFSAGSHPNGKVNPFAVELLSSQNMPVGELRSKSWDEFVAPGAPHLDFVFTVCDKAAGELCPVWPGQPMTAHWGIPDPAATRGDEAASRRAMHQAFLQLGRRISLFVSLPFDNLDAIAIKHEVAAIGRLDDASSRTTHPQQTRP